MLLTLLLALPTTLMAQQGLAIQKVLDGTYKKNPNTTDVEIFSNRLTEFNLTYYHSLTVTNDSLIMAAIAQAVMADEAAAVNKEVSYIGAKMYYGFLEMKRLNPGENRFIFYRDMRLAPHDASKPVVMLIYMEGSASLNELKNKFKN